MKGLLTKDFLTIRKKYGIPRVAMDIFIIVALMVVLKGTGAIYISFLLIPIEVMSMVMSLATCDQQWKWGKYAISLPVTKAQIVKSRYTFSVILSCVGFFVALMLDIFVVGKIAKPIAFKIVKPTKYTKPIKIIAIGTVKIILNINNFCASVGVKSLDFV